MCKWTKTGTLTHNLQPPAWEASLPYVRLVGSQISIPGDNPGSQVTTSPTISPEWPGLDS